MKILSHRLPAISFFISLSSQDNVNIRFENLPQKDFIIERSLVIGSDTNAAIPDDSGLK